MGMAHKETDGPWLVPWIIGAAAVLAVFLVFNQVLLSERGIGLPGLHPTSGASVLAGVDVASIQSTAQGIDAVFALQGKTPAEVQQAMLPHGTPDYAAAMGVSFDDPEGSLVKLANAYPALKEEVKTEDPQGYARWLRLASQPKGISCEFCCGIGAYEITPTGQDMCGCQHAPALQSVALWLIHNTNYSDAQVLQEVYRWKTLFFPQEMISLGTQIAGGDGAATALPQQVGDC